MAGKLSAAKFGKKYVKLVQKLTDSKLSRSEKIALKEEAAEDRAELAGKAEKTVALETLNNMIRVADARGGPAVEEAGEDAVVAYLYSVTDAEDRADSFLFNLIAADDEPLARNPSTGTIFTRDDAQAAVALLGADPGQRKFKPAKAEDDEVDLAARLLAAEYATADAATAAALARLDSYAAGLEKAWRGLTVKQREKALAYVKEDADLPPALAKKILGVPSIFELTGASLKAVGGRTPADLDADAPDINARVLAHQPIEAASAGSSDDPFAV